MPLVFDLKWDVTGRQQVEIQTHRQMLRKLEKKVIKIASSFSRDPSKYHQSPDLISTLSNNEWILSP